MKTDAFYLQHMLEAAEEVRGHLKLGRNLTTRRAVERCLEIIGEAAGRISPALQKAHPEVEWKAITGLRHRIVHDYYDVRVDIVWDTAQTDLPALERQLEAIMRKLSKNG